MLALGPGLQQRGEGVVHDGWAVQVSDRVPRTDRRRAPAVRAALAGDWKRRTRTSPASRWSPGDARGREGSVEGGDPRQRSRSSFIEGELLYAMKGEVPDRRRLRDSARRCRGEARGRRTSASSRTARWCTRACRRRRSSRRMGSRRRWWICARSGRSMWRRSCDRCAKTNRAVYVEEGWALCRHRRARSSATIQEEAFDDLDAPVLRVYAGGRADAVREGAGEARRSPRPTA